MQIIRFSLFVLLGFSMSSLAGNVLASSLDGACGIRDFVALMPVYRYTPYGLLAGQLSKLCEAVR